MLKLKKEIVGVILDEIYNYKFVLIKMNEVYIQQGKNEIDTTFKLLEKAKYSIKDKILIKPNITMPFFSDKNITTSPKVIEGIVKYLRNKRIDDIIIAEGAGGAKDMSKHFEISGYKKLSERLKIPLVDLNQDEIVKLKVKKSYCLNEIPVAKSVLDRYVINVAKMKTHRMADFTLCLKNMMGAILPYDRKDIIHPLYYKFVGDKKRITKKEFDMIQEDFYKRLVDFYSVLKPQLNIIDAFVGKDGDGLYSDSGRNIKMNCVLLGDNSVAVDYVSSYLMKLNFDYVDYFNKKIKNLKDIKIISNKSIESLRKTFKPLLLTERIIRK